jgi:hypothetical protein
VGDEVLAGLTALIGVVQAGVDERLLNPGSIDRDRRVLGVLLDDREQIPEQAPLGRSQLGPLDRAALVGPIEAVDRRPGSDQRRSLRRGLSAVPVLRAGCAIAGVFLGPTAQALRWRFPLLRYRRPSSYRAAYAL